MSLAMGVGFGVLLGFFAYLITQHGKRQIGYAGSVVVSALLFIVMGLRFIESFKFMPAGLLVLLSAIVVARNVWILLNEKKRA